MSLTDGRTDVQINRQTDKVIPVYLPTTTTTTNNFVGRDMNITQRHQQLYRSDWKYTKDNKYFTSKKDKVIV